LGVEVLLVAAVVGAGDHVGARQARSPPRSSTGRMRSRTACGVPAIPASSTRNLHWVALSLAHAQRPRTRPSPR
jgi:hypothetical protein